MAQQSTVVHDKAGLTYAIIVAIVLMVIYRNPNLPIQSDMRHFLTVVN